MQVSAVMIVKNGATTIRRSLESLQAFDDVVVYDNGSTDGTQAIACTFANVNLIEGHFDGFGPTKNRAASHARHDWVLIIDSDEAVDETLAKALRTRELDERTIYIVNFLAYYRDIQVRYCGWNNQKIRRLYHRRVTRFNDNHVHENIIDTGMQKAPIEGNMKHYSYMSMSDFIIKADRYSSLYASDNAGKRRSSPVKAFLNAGYSFFRTYVLKRGFLDGYVGLTIAFSHMVTNFYKYMKLYERNLELQKEKDGR